jgi:serine/threonine protein kinase
MSLKSRTEKMGRMVLCRGLLAASARDPETILKLQAETTYNLSSTVNKYAAFPVPHSLVDLVTKMLDWDPANRISPSEALAHEFFQI